MYFLPHGEGINPCGIHRLPLGPWTHRSHWKLNSLCSDRLGLSSHFHTRSEQSQPLGGSLPKLRKRCFSSRSQQRLWARGSPGTGVWCGRTGAAAWAPSESPGSPRLQLEQFWDQFLQRMSGLPGLPPTPTLPLVEVPLQVIPWHLTCNSSAYRLHKV